VNLAANGAFPRELKIFAASRANKKAYRDPRQAFFKVISEIIPGLDNHLAGVFEETAVLDSYFSREQPF
jgi:hypothetical protein